MSATLDPRISREEMFLNMAKLVAQRGTCSRAQVGAVLVRDNRVISMGYNGAPPGMPHCDHGATAIEYLQEGNPTGCEIAVHAETNALLYAARSGTPTDASEMFCTHAPCLRCAQLIITAGVRSVTYEIPYRLTDGLELLDRAFIFCAQYITAATAAKPNPYLPEHFKPLLSKMAEVIDPLDLEVHDYVIPPREDHEAKPDWKACQVCGRPATDEIHLTGEGPHVPMIHR